MFVSKINVRFLKHVTLSWNVLISASHYKMVTAACGSSS